VDAFGRNGPVRSDTSGFERKLVRWCRFGMWDATWDSLNNREQQGLVTPTTPWISNRSFVHLDCSSREPHSGPGRKDVQALELQLIE
jgi:hypothetical protein